MMHDCEKSHSAIVAAKLTNKAGVPAAEPEDVLLAGDLRHFDRDLRVGGQDRSCGKRKCQPSLTQPVHFRLL
jgi:hypothetical protein